MAAGTAPQHDPVARHVGSQLRHRHDGAKRHIAGQTRIAVADQAFAEQRAKSIGSDQRCAGKRAAIGRCDRDAFAAILVRFHHRIGDELDRAVGPASVQQHVMQIDAVNDDVRVFETGAERGAGRYANNLLPGKRIEHRNCRRCIGNSKDLFHQAETVEHMKNVRSELNAVTDGAELRRAFKHARRAAALAQCQRRGQPAKSTADDQNGFTPGHTEY